MARTVVCGKESDGLTIKPINADFIKLAAAYDEAQRSAIEEVKAGGRSKT